MRKKRIIAHYVYFHLIPVNIDSNFFLNRWFRISTNAVFGETELGTR